MSIVITIADDHPHYRQLLTALEPSASEYAPLVIIERDAVGTWSLRVATALRRLNALPSNAYLVQIGSEKC